MFNVQARNNAYRELVAFLEPLSDESLDLLVKANKMESVDDSLKTLAMARDIGMFVTASYNTFDRDWSDVAAA